MRHPHKYKRGLNITFSFTVILFLPEKLCITDHPQYLVVVIMAVAGYLMFGESVREEITSNILLTEGYPRAITIIIVVFIAIIPLTKLPLK